MFGNAAKANEVQHMI